MNAVPYTDIEQYFKVGVDPSCIEIDQTRNSLLHENSIRMLKDGYMLPDEGPQELFARVSAAVADSEEHAQRLYDYVSKLWFMYSTPILSNAGTKRGLTISCFSSTVDDSLDSITDHWKEQTYLTAKGGGTSGYWGRLRTDGVATSKGSASSGLIPFLKVMDAVAAASKQGNVRRGAYAAYLDVSHPEIMEFIDFRDPNGDPMRRSQNREGFHHGVCITDAFMEAVEKDEDWNLIDPHTNAIISTMKAREVWRKIIEMRVKTGEPYIVFEDTVNRYFPGNLKKKGLKSNGSNLCVAPETKILTNNGHLPIESLQDRTVCIWNGFEWSDVVIRKTGVNKKLVTVNLSSGQSIDCTEQHIFYVMGVGYNKVVKKSASELKPGDKLIKFNLPILDGTENLPHAYANGFYSGDGCEVKGKQRIYLYGDKRKLKTRLGEIFDDWCYQSNQNREYGHTKLLKDKFFVPDSSYTLKSRVDWFSGLLDSDGTVTRNVNTQSLQVASVNNEFLINIQMMLQTLGVFSKISKVRESGLNFLPKNDGSGDLGLYNTQTVYRLMVTQDGIEKLLSLGMKTDRLVITNHKANRECSHYIKVLSVEDNGRISDTYCFTEHKKGYGVFNGVLTGQCSEITLPKGKDYLDKDRTFVCCLSSVNLDKWDEWKDDPLFISDLIRMLDNNITLFLDNAPRSMYNAWHGSRMTRDLGLGTMGFHSLLQRKGLAFESSEAVELNNQIYYKIWKESSDASLKLGEERAPHPDSYEIVSETSVGELYVGGKTNGFRNAHRLAIAPNASSSTICGDVSPSIEPYSYNYKVETRKVGILSSKNPHLEALLESKGKNTDEVWNSIKKMDGSVQHLTFLTDQEKLVFKTAREIDQQWVVEHAAARQPFICQSQSVNLFITPKTPIKEINKVHMSAWKKGLKTLYYLRNMSVGDVKGISVVKSRESVDPDLVGCKSCEG